IEQSPPDFIGNLAQLVTFACTHALERQP
ncbi:MAG: hypothetical protein JWN04_4780, partial [Myxococcaceae bacterium]|nr:hypothetical protein [Myxococcaceae bacterium]